MAHSVPVRRRGRRTRWTKARLDKQILEHAQTATTLAVKLRLSVQNNIDRRSGILDEKPPEVTTRRSSLLGGRRLDS